MTPATLIGFQSRRTGRVPTPPAPPQGPTRYRAVRVDGNRGRFYEVTDLETGELRRKPSITHVLDKGLPKGQALLRWMAQTERTAALEAAADLHAELAGHPQLPRALYLAALDAKLGKAKRSDTIRDEAGLVGAAAHAWVAWDLKRRCGIVGEKEPKLAVPAQHAIEGYLTWAAQHDVEPIAVEQVAFSWRYGVAGTLDCLAKVDGVPMVLDLKTGKAVYPEALLQVGFYAYALLEMGVVSTLPAGLVLRLPKRTTDPIFEAVPVPTREAMPIVLAARAIWTWGTAQEQLYRERTRTKETRTALPTAAEPIAAAPVVAPAEPVTAVLERWPAATAPITVTASHGSARPLTHYAIERGRRVASVCGRVLEDGAITTAPTCPDCAHYVATVNLDEPPF